MKRITLFILMIIPLLGITQARIGSTEQVIKNEFPDKTWSTGRLSDGKAKFISTDFDYGNFTYYISDSTKLCYMCIQMPKDMVSLNTLVQMYNGKYSINSKTSWTAYLEGGSIINITLKYIDEDKIYAFYYQLLN